MAESNPWAATPDAAPLPTNTPEAPAQPEESLYPPGEGQKNAAGRTQVTVRPMGQKSDISKDNPWREDAIAISRNTQLRQNPGLLGHMQDFFRFFGHGTTRGIAEVPGFPVDAYNLTREFLLNFPREEAPKKPSEEGVIAKNTPEATKPPGPVYTGSSKFFKEELGSLGLPSTTPAEEGVTGSPAKWGDVLGEFGGANIPFVAFAPAKIPSASKAGWELATNAERIWKSERPAMAALHDLGYGVWGPGVGAVAGEEIAGPENEAMGKAVGAAAGGARLQFLEMSLQRAKQGYSWLHDFVGVGTGAEGKVGKAVKNIAEDLPKALENIEKLPNLSPGAKLPTDIASQDNGLIALRRSIMATDAELAGNYRGMQNATQRAIVADSKLSPANFNDVESWLAAKQRALEHLSDRRLQQAVEQADRDTDVAFHGTYSNPVDANAVKNAYSLNLRKQLLLAEDDMNAVVREKWSQVNMDLPADMSPVYDALHTIQAEHKLRQGESDARFPTEVFNRFFKDKPQWPLKSPPKFGVGTKLQDVVDLDSEIQQEIRQVTAQDAPDRVKLAYLRRISESLNTVKNDLPGADSSAALRDALAATKQFHKTFHSGPVGQVLGHDAPGAPDVFPGNTLKHFLSQGPGGIDSFDTLMKAFELRTGKSTPVVAAAIPDMIKNYIRQDFYDTVMAGGVFNAKAGEKWLSNNAGPMLHYDDLRTEFSQSIRSQDVAGRMATMHKQEIDQLRHNSAALFLDGEPGKLFNGALRGPNKYERTKELVAMTRDDPTGRATEGLVQMALDHMIGSSMVVDRTSSALERLNGLSLNKWMEDNGGVVKALNEAMPGVGDRFQRIADTGRYLERFHVSPEVPMAQETGQQLLLRDLVARIVGARLGADVGHGGGSIQTAAIGSQALKQLAKQLTPDQVSAVLRRAMVDPEFFKELAKPYDATTAAAKIRILQPYFYSMNIPIMQEPVRKQWDRQAPDEGTVRKQAVQ